MNLDKVVLDYLEQHPELKCTPMTVSTTDVSVQPKVSSELLHKMMALKMSDPEIETKPRYVLQLTEQQHEALIDILHESTAYKDAEMLIGLITSSN